MAPESRVLVFLDYQNVYHRARDAYHAPADSAACRRSTRSSWAGFSRIASHVAAWRAFASTATPQSAPAARSYSAFQRQTLAQVRRGAGLVSIVARDGAIRLTGHEVRRKRRESTSPSPWTSC